LNITLSNPLPTLPSAKKLPLAIDVPNAVNNSEAKTNEPTQPVSKPRQIERITSSVPKGSSNNRLAAAPIEQYQNVEAIESREVLNSLVGIDIYI